MQLSSPDMSSSTTGRRAGLSRNARPPPLLKSLPSRNTAREAGTNKKRSRTPEKEVDVLAPPISSGDEDSSEEDGRDPVADAEKGGKSPISSGNESPDRADIRPTTFPSSWNSTTSTASNRSRIQYGSSQKGVKRYGLARSSQESKPSSSQRSRNEKEPRDGLDPVKGDSLLRDPDRTFKKGNGAKPSSPRASRQKRTKKAATERERSSTPPRIILPDDLLSPERNSKGASALDIPAAIADTPSPERPPQSLRVLSRSPSAPAAEANLDTRFLGHSDDDSGVESKRRRISCVSLADGPAEPQGNATDALKKGPTRSKTKHAPTTTQVDLSFDVDDSPLSDPSSVDGFADERTTKAQCPYCKNSVDKDALEKFSKGAYMTLRMQRRFCTQHKINDARAEWKTKGYPDIDWAHLDERISSHHSYLEQILRGKRCYYGDLLAKDVKAGLKRDLAKADFNSTPGYYGERGFRIMQEGIFARFSKLLRKRAVEDGLVSARGYSLYVQAVLVPELAVRLVMEDMGVGEGAARGILEESTWVGDLLCEDEGDVVDENDEKLF
ncbi:hypothetical protein VUR80DRAFT_7375 [Thermomyces stellatus]